MKSFVPAGAALALALGGLLLFGCGKEISYEDPGALTVSEDFSDSDIRASADEFVNSFARFLEETPEFTRNKPALLLLDMNNRTTRHLNTRIIIDRIETAVIKGRKVTLIAGEAREALAKEYQYNSSGLVEPRTQIGPGQQRGVQYIVGGTIENVPAKEVGGIKIDYYYLKLYLVDLKTNEKLWQEQKEIKKRIKK